MLPPSQTVLPAASSILAVSVLVVPLPFVPVMPMTLLVGHSRRNTSTAVVILFSTSGFFARMTLGFMPALRTITSYPPRFSR